MSAPARAASNGVAVAPPKRPVLPTIGETITAARTQNTYTIGGPIGEGAYSFVFECKDAWGNDLAAKVLKATHTYEAVRDRAVAEYEKLVLLRHPNITYVHDAFEFRDTFYIVTERCHFSIAQQLIARGGLGALLVRPIARCVLQAVNFLHLHKIAHQDIHVGNVFGVRMRSEGNAKESGALNFKLGDLGIARLFQEVSMANTRAEWMRPPEVLNSAAFGRSDHRVDIYHTGLLLLQVALGREVRFSPDEIIAGRPRELALGLPASLSTAIERALRRHVAQRTADARSFWQDLSTAR